MAAFWPSAGSKRCAAACAAAASALAALVAPLLLLMHGPYAASLPALTLALRAHPNRPNDAATERRMRIS